LIAKFLKLVLILMLSKGNLLSTLSASAYPDQSKGWNVIGQAGGPAMAQPPSPAT
jgi:hypothetical protein